MEKMIRLHLLFLFMTMMLFAGCGGGGGGGGSESNPATPLSAADINLIFVTSPDLAYHTPGDVQPDTANLTAQGLRRSLMMATFLQDQVLGGENVDKIYALSPMSHLQTVNNYPNMAAIGFIQHFALLNQNTLPITPTETYTANTFPINVSYTRSGVPGGVVRPSSFCPDCTGLDFNNDDQNVDLVSGIIKSQIPGYYVFSAPWKTLRTLLAAIDARHGYGINPPSDFLGSNYVHAISITSSGDARLNTFNSGANPMNTYPVLPPVAAAACAQTQPPVVLTGGVNGVAIPPGINRNSKVHLIRHAEAHPGPEFRFENGNYVGAGQWRALSLAHALKDKISPDVVVSIDPAAVWYQIGSMRFSYVRPSLTILPYVVARNLPFHLAAGVSLESPWTRAHDPGNKSGARDTSDFLFTGGAFSNQTVLVVWESQHSKPFLNALIRSYGGNNIPLLEEGWPPGKYDVIWTVTLDAQGNLTIDNELCQGIDSASLPEAAPRF